ncbi:MAG: YggS family pyridoxal phosphate-dependent enzyme [Ilumatobacter sp.]|nr:YggS family pyridoxal phosphate-dependent enzyme [Ilumatobacter sp.]
MNDAATVAEQLGAVEARIAVTGGHDVQIVAVTKGFGPEVVDVAAEAGCGAIGENYAQELLAKQPAIERHPGLDVHFIGQLQTNKVRQLAGLVALYESVDRAKLVREIAKRDPGAAVLLQVDTSSLSGLEQSTKGGCPIAELDQLVADARAAGLDLRGLMTVGPTEGGARAARRGFDAVRSAVDRHGLTVCSMGMSADLEVAVECGSTEVRIGTALFGPRPS